MILNTISLPCKAGPIKYNNMGKKEVYAKKFIK
jgi:hypothetical protein